MAKTEEKAQKKLQPGVMNRTELAHALGIAPTTLDKWIREGCPYVQRGVGQGQSWQFNLAAVIAWVRARDVEQATGKVEADEAQLKKRRAMADTMTAELTLAKAKGEVAPIQQMERMVARAFAEVCAGMQQLPGRVVSRLIGETNERQFKAVLLEEINQVLAALPQSITAVLAEADQDDGDENEQ